MLLPSHYSSNCFHTLRTHCPPVIFFNCRRFGVSICIIVFSGDGALSFVWGCFIRITGYVESVYVRQYIYFNSRRRCLVQKKWRAFFPGMYHLPRGYFVLSPFFFFSLRTYSNTRNTITGSSSRYLVQHWMRHYLDSRGFFVRIPGYLLCAYAEQYVH